MRHVTLSAGEIEYDETGSGPPVVLLHGLLMDHTLWDEVLPLLPEGFRYVRPVLPLGAHRLPMRPGADLGMAGMGRLLAEFLEELDLTGVTLVHTDWGGGLFLTALGLHERLARQVILPCEAFDNFPPGLPGRTVSLVSRIPGGLALAARQLRVRALRNSPFMLGPMSKRPLPDALVRGWTEPLLREAGCGATSPRTARRRSTRRGWSGTRRRCATSPARRWCCGRPRTSSCRSPTASGWPPCSRRAATRRSRTRASWPWSISRRRWPGSWAPS
ncbi:oxidoreductase [Streptomyces sp. SPB074]|nr:oxidoreductase [Streptomyces sp. SPB074]